MVMMKHSAPPQAVADELRALHAVAQVLNLLSDPQATKERVAALTEVAADHQKKLDTVAAENAALDAKRRAHLEQLAEERAAHEEKIRTERIAFDNECTRRATALHDAEEKAAAAQAAADTARLHAVAISTDLENRLALIASASTAPLPARH
jgi:hypothetical protein